MPSDSHINTVNFVLTCRSTQNATRGAIFLRIADRQNCGTRQRSADVNRKASVRLCVADGKQEVGFKLSPIK